MPGDHPARSIVAEWCPNVSNSLQPVDSSAIISTWNILFLFSSFEDRMITFQSELLKTLGFRQQSLVPKLRCHHHQDSKARIKHPRQFRNSCLYIRLWAIFLHFSHQTEVISININLLHCTLICAVNNWWAIIENGRSWRLLEMHFGQECLQVVRNRFWKIEPDFVW